MQLQSIIDRLDYICYFTLYRDGSVQRRVHLAPQSIFVSIHAQRRPKPNRAQTPRQSPSGSFLLPQRAPEPVIHAPSTKDPLPSKKDGRSPRRVRQRPGR